jgi:hypothetical protein
MQISVVFCLLPSMVSHSLSLGKTGITLFIFIG